MPPRPITVCRRDDQLAYYTIEDRVAAPQALFPAVVVRIIPVSGHWATYEFTDASNTTR